MKKTNIALIAILSLIPIFHTKITAQLPSYLPTNGLVAWYPFNGNANDESGNGTNGIVNGATLVPNRFGQSNSAYSFDGINDFIQYPQGSNTPINIVGDISFGYWIKTTSTEGIITSFGDQLAGQGGYLSGLRDGSAEPSPGRLGYWVGGTWITSSALINDNNWTFIMVTYTGGQLKLYVNGNLDSQHSGMPAASWNGNRTLGKPNYVDVRFFSGLIDDFVIYSRALSATEINSLYTANSGNNTSNTVNPAPPGIPYQAEVRNDSGEVLANANVNIRFTLHELAANGTVSYQETHALATNELGLFAATIGAGTATQGTFAGINWSQTTKFLQVEVDAGNGYITMGNQQLMSVPYALYAANGPAGPQGPAGADGQQGPQGQNGLSAYEVWLDQGNIGTVDEFISSISPNHPTAYGFRNRFMFNAPSCGDASNNIIVLDSIQSSNGGFFYELTIKISQVGWVVFNTNFYIQNEQGLNIPCSFNMPLTPDNYQLSFANFDSAVGGNIYATNRLLTLYIMVPQMEEENLKLMFSFNYDDMGDPCGASGGIDIQTILHH